MCVDNENAISKNPPLLIAQDTQHKLGVAFSYLERNYYRAKRNKKKSTTGQSSNAEWRYLTSRRQYPFSLKEIYVADFFW